MIKYEFGQLFLEKEDNEIYILAEVDACRAALISLRDGQRWDDPVDVHWVLAIDEDIFDKLIANTKDTNAEFVPIRSLGI